MEATVGFKFKDTTIPLAFNYRITKKEIPKRFGINLLQVFTSDEETNKLAQDLVFDDEKTLDLMKFFISESRPELVEDEDDFLDNVNPQNVHQFREVFWEAYANFSGPLKRSAVIQIWDELKKKMKNPNLLLTAISQPSASE